MRRRLMNGPGKCAAAEAPARPGGAGDGRGEGKAYSSASFLISLTSAVSSLWSTLSACAMAEVTSPVTSAS